ncbi:MAG: helix-turn-helix domain-containing protein [Tissierellia bacterium]|nr:helix-turn-helix domain-containing protein [Tissierellia bacterium]
MDDINRIVATNLKKIREKNKLSLDNLSELTGVSKSMLGQIERGESNPTLQTIWKIATGLKISLTSLIVATKPEAEIIKKSNISPIVADGGKFRIYPIFPFDYEKRFEVLNIELEPGASSISEPHDEYTEEYVLVLEGEFTVKIDGDIYKVGAGDAIRYRADRAHGYYNLSDNLTRISMVIYYPNIIMKE